MLAKDNKETNYKLCVTKHLCLNNGTRAYLNRKTLGWLLLLSPHSWHLLTCSSVDSATEIEAQIPECRLRVRVTPQKASSQREGKVEVALSF